MIVYLEGADGSGKTTLLEKLKLLGYSEVESLPRMKDKYKEREQWLNFANKYGESSNIYVVDRGPLTEFVYRQVQKDRSYLLLDDLHNLLYHCKIILCDTPCAFDRAMKRGEDNIVDKQIHARIRETYLYAMQMIEAFVPCKIKLFDTTQLYDNIPIEILQFINRSVEEWNSTAL